MGTRSLRVTGAVALVVAGCAAALALVEVGVRTLSPRPPLLYRPHPALGWVHPPGKTVLYPGHSGPARVTFNSRGLRDREHSQEKSPNTARILILGDSYTEAADMDGEEAFPRRLEQILNQKGMRAEVINAGVGGYGTDQQLLYLRQEGLRYHPDLVLLAFTVDNDVYDNWTKKYCELTDQGLTCRSPVQHGMARRGIVAVKAFLQEHFHVYFFLNEKIQRIYSARWLLARLGFSEVKEVKDVAGGTNHLPKELRMMLVEQPTDVNSGWELTLAILREMKEETQKAGAQFAIAVIPSGLALQEELLDRLVRTHGVPRAMFDIKRPHKILEEFGRVHGVPIIDLLPAFADAGARGEELTRGHWTAAGHRVAAEAIAREVVRMPFLSRKRDGT